MSDTVTLPVNPEVFWGLVTLAAVLLAMLTVLGVLSGVRPDAEDTPFNRLRTQLGMAGLSQGVFALGMILWGLIFAVLFLGLLWTIISAATHALVTDVGSERSLRGTLITLTALTATLGAVVAFPVTLIRIALTRKQTATAEEALFNDKINAAAGGLAARRQVSRVIHGGTDKETILTEWQDDLVTRASAIDRLEGLAKERPDTAARVARMLSIYVRELSREYPAQKPPEGVTVSELRNWAWSLKPIRPDMGKAAQSLGRLQDIEGHNIKPGDIDLSEANLQGCRLEGCNFDQADLSDAFLQGARFGDARRHDELQAKRSRLNSTVLTRAKLHGAYLGFAIMQRAYLKYAKMDGVNLNGTQLSGSTLMNAEMNGAFIEGADVTGANLKHAVLCGVLFRHVKMDDETNLDGATLTGSAMKSIKADTREADTWCLRKLTPLLASNRVFADGTVQLPVGEPRPDDWRDEFLIEQDFHTRWHAWQETLPDFDPSWRRD